MTAKERFGLRKHQCSSSGQGKSEKTGTKQSATFFYAGPVSTHIPLIWNHLMEHGALIDEGKEKEVHIN